MRNTPVEDYLEEVSTTLPEEIYGRLSDAIYETNVDFDQEIESRVAENAKLRELASTMWPYIWEAYYSGEMPYADYAIIRDRMQELGIGGSR